MKNVYLLFLCVFIFTSCDITEKIYFDADESVTYSIETDFSALTKMDEDQFKGELDENYPIDTIMTMKEFSEWDVKKNNQNVSKFDNQYIVDLFKNFKIHTVMNDDVSKMALFTHQNSTTALNQKLAEVYLNFKKFEAEEGVEMASLNNLLFGYLFQKHQFKYDGEKFSRISILDGHAFDEALFGGDKDMGLGAFLLLTNYKTEYHFPKPIQFVSDTTVKLSWDRKTIYLENSISDLIENPNVLNLKITLED